MNALREPLGSPRIVVRVPQDHLRRRGGELGDELDELSGARRHTRLGLDGGKLLHAEPVAQVSLIAVNHHDADAFERRGPRLPPHGSLLPALVKILAARRVVRGVGGIYQHQACGERLRDRKSTRLNSSHSQISYAVFCLKKKKKKEHEADLHTSTQY